MLNEPSSFFAVIVANFEKYDLFKQYFVRQNKTYFSSGSYCFCLSFWFRPHLKYYLANNGIRLEINWTLATEDGKDWQIYLSIMFRSNQEKVVRGITTNWLCQNFFIQSCLFVIDNMIFGLFTNGVRKNRGWINSQM